MLDKLKKVVVVFVAVIILTGCSSTFNGEVKINKDKSMEYSVILGINKELLNSMGATDEELPTQADINNDPQYKDLLSKGITVTPYSNDKVVGTKFLLNIKNIDDFSDEQGSVISLSAIANDYNKFDFRNDDKTINMFKKEQGLLKDTYSAHFYFDLNEFFGGNTGTSGEFGEMDSSEDMDGDMEELAKLLDISFKVTLPDGATKTWKIDKIDKDKPRYDYEFSFDLANENINVVYLAGGAGLLIFIIIIFSAGKNKGDKYASQPAFQTSSNNSAPQGSFKFMDASMAPAAPSAPKEPEVLSTQNVVVEEPQKFIEPSIPVTPVVGGNVGFGDIMKDIGPLDDPEEPVVMQAPQESQSAAFSFTPMSEDAIREAQKFEQPVVSKEETIATDNPLEAFSFKPIYDNNDMGSKPIAEGSTESDANVSKMNDLLAPAAPMAPVMPEAPAAPMAPVMSEVPVAPMTPTMPEATMQSVPTPVMHQPVSQDNMSNIN